MNTLPESAVRRTKMTRRNASRIGSCCFAGSWWELATVRRSYNRPVQCWEGLTSNPAIRRRMQWSLRQGISSGALSCRWWWRRRRFPVNSRERGNQEVSKAGYPQGIKELVQPSLWRLQPEKGTLSSTSTLNLTPRAIWSSNWSINFHITIVGFIIIYLSN